MQILNTPGCMQKQIPWFKQVLGQELITPFKNQSPPLWGLHPTLGTAGLNRRSVYMDKALDIFVSVLTMCFVTSPSVILVL